MQAKTISQAAKGIIATAAGVILALLPFLLDANDATKWTSAIVAVCMALGVVITPNAPTRQQYQAVARDVLGTSLVSAVPDSNGHLAVITADARSHTVTITPNPDEGPILTPKTAHAGRSAQATELPGDSGPLLGATDTATDTGEPTNS